MWLECNDMHGGTSNFYYMYLHGSESLDSVDFKSKVQFSKQKKELFLLMPTKINDMKIPTTL